MNRFNGPLPVSIRAEAELPVSAATTSEAAALFSTEATTTVNKIRAAVILMNAICMQEGEAGPVLMYTISSRTGVKILRHKAEVPSECLG